MNTKIVKDELVQENGYWIVYRESYPYGRCPIYKTKDKKMAELLIV